MSVNTHIGRPKRYESQADKQKAYRERKKESLNPVNALRNKVDTLKAIVLEASLACDKHRASFGTIKEDEYPRWLAENTRLQDVWWKAHGEHYVASLELDAVLHEGKARDWYNFMKRSHR